jgi:hypothetical protein
MNDRPPPSEIVTRQALAGIELFDPVTLTRVTRGVSIVAEGLANPPVLSLGGCFVWLAEEDAWPGGYFVGIGSLPYEPLPDKIPSRPRPGDLKTAPMTARLTRVVLTPSVDYPFPDAMTRVYGRLRESAGRDAAPVAEAKVWLQWPVATDEGLFVRIDSDSRASTNARGEFVALLTSATRTLPRDTTDLCLVVSPRDGETLYWPLEPRADGLLPGMGAHAGEALVIARDEMRHDPP